MYAEFAKKEVFGQLRLVAAPPALRMPNGTLEERSTIENDLAHKQNHAKS